MDKIPAELSEKFGFEGEMSMDDFVAKHNEEFIKRSEATKDESVKREFNTDFFKTVEKATLRTFNSAGIEIPEEVLRKDGKPIKYEELINYGLSQIKSQFENEKKELETKVKTKGESEALKQWEEKYGKLEKKYQDTEGLLKSTSEEYNKYRENVATEIRSSKINDAFSSLLKEVKSTIKPTAKPLEIEGFESRVQRSFKPDLDEEGRLYLTNEKGERIKSKVKIGSFADPKEILTSLIDELELSSKNPDGGKEIKKPTVQSDIPPKPTEGLRKPHPLTQGIKVNMPN